MCVACARNSFRTHTVVKKSFVANFTFHDHDDIISRPRNTAKCVAVSENSDLDTNKLSFLEEVFGYLLLHEHTVSAFLLFCVGGIKSNRHSGACPELE